MLIFTLAMRFLTLVYLAIFLTQCQAITVRDDDYYTTPKTYTYSDSEIARSELDYNQEDYDKPLRRADARNYQYASEENNQEADYTQQESDKDIDYPYTESVGRQQIARRRTPAKKQHVEQYLKEVTPTTKTAYNQRSGNYLRSTSQPHDRGIKEQAELQRSILKQPSIQYIVQSDLQQKSETHPQIQYIIPEKPAQSRPSDQQSNSATLAAYQNALLAHQKVLETEGQNQASSRSSIYVSHSIPKKPVRKLVKPTARDEDTDLQQYQLQQKQPIYERPRPAEIAYQPKLEYSSRDTNYPSATELPKYEREKQLIRQRLQELTQYQQIPSQEPLPQQEKVIYQPQQLARYQQILSSSQGKIPQPINQQAQIPPESNYQRPEATLEYKVPSRLQDPAAVQYRQPIYVKKGPKYLPEPKPVTYQVEETEQKYPANVPNQPPAALISFEEAIAKLQSEKLLKARQQRLRPQPTYQQEQSDVPVAYTLLTGEQQDGRPQDTGYVRIGETNNYRPVENAAPVSYRQPHQNANVRYYRRPAIAYSQQQ